MKSFVDVLADFVKVTESFVNHTIKNSQTKAEDGQDVRRDQCATERAHNYEHPLFVALRRKQRRQQRYQILGLLLLTGVALTFSLKILIAVWSAV